MTSPAIYTSRHFWLFGSSFSALSLLSAYLLSRIGALGSIDPDALAYCEASTGGWLRQPANSLANLAFFWVGAAIYAEARRAAGASWALRRPLALQRMGFAIACVCIGMGSLWFHATLTKWAGFADNFAMNLIATQMLVYSWERSFRWSLARSASVLFALNLLLDVLVLRNNLGKLSFGIVVATSMVTEISIVLGRSLLTSCGEGLGLRVRRYTRDTRLLAATIGVFVPGALVWQHSRTGNFFCLPMSWLQGHAFWHLSSACAVFIIYLYFRSERRLPVPQRVILAPAPTADLDSFARLLVADGE